MGQPDLFGQTAIAEPTFEQEYQEYITSAKWRLKRQQALHRAGHKCERCGLSKWSVKLEVHHKTYENFKAELLSDLEVVCVDCHAKADEERRRRVEVERRHRSAARLWDARLEGWATKVYGEDWHMHDQDQLESQFHDWLLYRS